MIQAIVRESDGRIMAFNLAGHGYTERNESGFKMVILPDQDVDIYYRETETGEILKEIYYPDDIQTWSLSETKARKLDKIRSKANEIITKKWPAYKQRNADAGIYPQATKDQKDQDIADVISASNSAEDEVDNASTIAEVEAVSPTWPTI